MRKSILLLPLALSSVYAIGFWGSVGGGLNFGGFSDWEKTASANGLITGIDLMGGISFQHTPISVGLGVDYYAGTHIYKEADLWGVSTEEVEVKRTYVKLPVAYQLSRPMFKGYFGFYPAYATYSMYSMKGKGEPDSTNYWIKGRGEPDSESIVFKSIVFKGLALGFFTNLYYSIGPLGIGGGIFFDYGPRFKGSVTHINNVLYLGINLGLLLSLGVLE
jgi:hypothetical protein